jgi:hypothetical protein
VIGCAASEPPGELPKVFILRPDVIRQVRDSVRAGSSDSPALGTIRRDAERSLKVEPVSVMEKTSVPPSGDKHDYMSLAPYWWPDPKSSNGLPYIRRDGERNPELAGIPDHKNFDTVISSARKLALAYYLFGDERYAAKATDWLRTWFFDPRTRMNPSLQYAQAVKGRNDGRGTGLIETRAIGNVVDAVGLLAGSRSWTEADQAAMQDWCGKFLDWMLTSANGKDEAQAKNNHGTFYDVQVVALALFTGRKDLARSVADAARKRVETQVEPDGSQPLELARTKSFSYSAFNLVAFFDLARLAENTGVDLWSFHSKDGRSIRAALDYLLPYSTGDRKWTRQQIEPISAKELVPLLLEASMRYKAPEYRAAALKIDPAADNSVQALLLGSDSTGVARK